MSSIIAGVIGAILSILVETVPGFDKLWNAWQWKRLTLFVACFVVSFALLLLCYEGAPVGFECAAPFLWAGLWQAVIAALAAFAGSQIMFIKASRQLADRHSMDYIAG